ncbi:hypothetical protein KI387_018683, partial [Taxus chinensis]
IDIDNSVSYVAFKEYEIEQCRYHEKDDFLGNFMFDAASKDVKKLGLGTWGKPKKMWSDKDLDGKERQSYDQLLKTYQDCLA